MKVILHWLCFNFFIEPVCISGDNNENNDDDDEM